MPASYVPTTTAPTSTVTASSTPRTPQFLPGVRPLLIVAGSGLFVFCLLATMIITTGGTDGFDQAISVLADQNRTSTGIAVAQVITSFGSYAYVIVLTVVLAGLALLASRSIVPPLVLLISTPFASAAVFLIKVAIGRTRPASALLLGEAPTDYAFPSGHTTSGTLVFVLGAMIISGYLASRLLRRAIRTSAVIIAVLIGASRVYLGYHWTTDVLGGWCLAVAITACGLLAVRMLTASTSLVLDRAAAPDEVQR